MASEWIPAPEGQAPAPSLVRPAQAAAQAEVVREGGGARRGRLRLRTLVGMRWLLIGIEVLGLGAGAVLMKLQAPYLTCFAIVGAWAWFNLLSALTSPRQRLCSDRESTLQLAFDIVQITLLVGLTGGAANPFMLFLIAPIALGATSLPQRSVLLLGLLGVAAAVGLAMFAWAPHGGGGPFQAAPPGLRLAGALACIMGIALVAGHVRQAALETARMGLALDVTEAVLAREQKLSALGALAAAAAHELGTPLATISIVAKELSREAPTTGVKEDAELLIAQADRCREILKRLTDSPETADQMHERMSLVQLLHEVIEPHASAPGVRVEAIVSGAAGSPAPDIWRMPEVLHAMTTFVENAVDFAESEVLITARFDAETVSMEVRDDGPGFAPEILARLGEPYLTSRPGAEGSRTGLSVVEAVRGLRPDSRIIMLTGYGNIATAVAAVKAGAVDYLSKPADADDVARALLARGDVPAPPENPMSADRVRWEHIQRIYEMCGHNVSETARRLNMHRRTLQRILAKRAPR